MILDRKSVIQRKKFQDRYGAAAFKVNEDWWNNNSKSATQKHQHQNSPERVKPNLINLTVNNGLIRYIEKSVIAETLNCEEIFSIKHTLEELKYWVLGRQKSIDCR